MALQSTNDQGLRELALFAGAGGGILGGKLLGWRTVCAVEYAPYPRSILLARQRDGILEPFPIWDDVRTFDGTPWRGKIDVISGGFPCQDISIAGNGDGLDGERSGLWKEMRRIIGEIRPRFVLVENSPMLVIRGGDRVLGDLAALGYDARWGIISARHAGAPHLRERIWIVAHSKSQRDCSTSKHGDGGKDQESKGQSRRGGLSKDLAHPGCKRSERHWDELGFFEELRQGGKNPKENCNPWNGGDPADQESLSESFMGRVADGVANRVDRIKAIGNGQVPAVVRLAWETLRP